MSRRGWPRTSDLLFVRQALVPTELLAHEWTGRESNPRTTALFAAATTTGRLLCRTLSYPAHRIRDKESNLDLQVQSLASCRLDDPGKFAGGHSGAEAPAG